MAYIIAEKRFLSSGSYHLTPFWPWHLKKPRYIEKALGGSVLERERKNCTESPLGVYGSDCLADRWNIMQYPGSFPAHPHLQWVSEWHSSLEAAEVGGGLEDTSGRRQCSRREVSK